jgi:hypothetical protein
MAEIIAVSYIPLMTDFIKEKYWIISEPVYSCCGISLNSLRYYLAAFRLLMKGWLGAGSGKLWEHLL